MLDFDAEWAALQEARRKPACSAKWDEKAPRYDSKDARNRYAEDFLALARLEPGESVFDMGCGTGALAVPAALAGHGVIGADFSGGMVAKMRENMAYRAVPEVSPAQAASGVCGIAPVLMSWEDDWRAFGIEENMVDVAFASRSVAVCDLRDALRKLTAVARKRCCITMATSTSPRVDPQVLAAIGVPASPTRDYLYAFGMLAQAGFEPHVSFIHSPRKDTFASREAALRDFTEMIEVGAAGLDAQGIRAARMRLEAWIDDHMTENPEVGKPDKKGVPQGALMLDYIRVVPWAFLSWDVRGGKL